MRFCVLLLALAPLVALSCGGDPAATTPAATTPSATASQPPAWPPPPSAYDCRAAAPPERASLVPPACIADRGCRKRMVCGHRGAGGDLGKMAPENTRSAVRAAIAHGAEFIETDPRPTKDGIVVNVHDTDVGRVTTGEGEVDQMTLAELQALPLKTSKYEGDFSCERIATIEEILQLARGRIHVLLDANKTDDMAPLVDLVKRTDTLDWAILDTDNADKIAAALALEPRLLTMIRVSSEAELNDELARFADHPPVLIEIRDGGDLGSLVPMIHARGHRAFTNAFVHDLSAGLQGNPALYDELWGKGLDVLQTDRIDLMLRGLRPPP